MPLQHKSPETIYRGQEAYVRIDAQAFQEHGEVKITGEPIIADEVVKKVNRNGFEITYLTYLVDLVRQARRQEVHGLQVHPCP